MATSWSSTLPISFADECTPSHPDLPPLQDPDGDKLVINAAHILHPPVEALHSVAQELRDRPHPAVAAGETATPANGGDPGSPPRDGVTFNPYRGAAAGEVKTPPRLGGGGGGNSQSSAAVAAASEEMGAEGRPVLRYNPFGADARVSTEGLVAAAALMGGGGGSAEAEAARRQQAMEKRAAAVQEVWGDVGS